MQITAAQLLHLQNYTEEDFLARVMQSVVEEHAADPDDPALRSTCERLVHQARNWGFSTELEVATFSLCGFLFGADFRGRAGLPFRALLMDQTMTHAEKSDKMTDLLQDFQDGLSGDENEATGNE